MVGRPDGATVGWAFPGFSPHHRKNTSYYPLVAHMTRWSPRLKNRLGNVHDSKKPRPCNGQVVHRTTA
jgi:hypothetical protein